MTTPLDLRVAELLLAGVRRLQPQQHVDQHRREAELADPIAVPRFFAPAAGRAPAAGEGDKEEQELTAAFGAKSMLASMLTDYHLHLRPDEDGTTFERYFTAENVDRYLAAAEAAGSRSWASPSTFTASARRSTSGAIRSGSRTPSTTSTPTASSSAARRCGSGSSATTSPAPRSGSRRCWTPRDFDYVVGSVHFIGEGDAAVDHDGFDVWEGGGDADEIWRRYFEALADCARSGLFDILAHPDLVKVWGRARPLPERDLRAFYEPAVEAIAESGIAVEVSTAGLRKPVGELYPSREFAEMCVEAGASFALSSDAHLPEQVGFEYDRAVDFLDELGVGEICVFEQRRRAARPRWAAASAEHGRASATTATASPRAAAWSSAGSRSSTTRASTATPTPTSSPTR